MQEQQAKVSNPISEFFFGVSLPIPRDYVLR